VTITAMRVNDNEAGNRQLRVDFSLDEPISSEAQPQELWSIVAAKGLVDRPSDRIEVISTVSPGTQSATVSAPYPEDIGPFTLFRLILTAKMADGKSNAIKSEYVLLADYL